MEPLLLLQKRPAHLTKSSKNVLNTVRRNAVMQELQSIAPEDVLMLARVRKVNNYKGIRKIE